MNYELVKKLKDVGFPLHDKPYASATVYTLDGTKAFVYDKTPEEYVQWLSDKGNPEVIVLPTLSELIDACGNNMSTLRRKLKDEVQKKYDESFNNKTQEYGFVYTEFPKEDWEWEAIIWSYKHICVGPTPEEAVANLYLALHPLPDAL